MYGFICYYYLDGALYKKCIINITTRDICLFQFILDHGSFKRLHWEPWIYHGENLKTTQIYEDLAAGCLLCKIRSKKSCVCIAVKDLWDKNTPNNNKRTLLSNSWNMIKMGTSINHSMLDSKDGKHLKEKTSTVCT